MCEKVCKSVAKCVKSLYILRMFGFNTPSIDSKGRIAIPARYRIDFTYLKVLTPDVVCGRVVDLGGKIELRKPHHEYPFHSHGNFNFLYV